MKYTSGDKVRVREDLVVGKEYGGVQFVPAMAKWRGTNCTINAAVSSSNDYSLVGDEMRWAFTDEMLEPAEHAPREIRIIIDGRTITAIEGEYKGIARCSPEDEFDLELGVRLAVLRLEESKAWPRVGDDCFEVTFCGSLGKFEAFSGNVASIDIPAVGKLIFRTKEEAQRMADKLNAVLEEDQ